MACGGASSVACVLSEAEDGLRAAASGASKQGAGRKAVEEAALTGEKVAQEGKRRGKEKDGVAELARIMHPSGGTPVFDRVMYPSGGTPAIWR